MTVYDSGEPVPSWEEQLEHWKKGERLKYDAEEGYWTWMSISDHYRSRVGHVFEEALRGRE